MRTLILSLLAVVCAVSVAAPAEGPWQRELSDALPARQVHLVHNAIDQVYRTANLKVEGLPSAGRVSLLHQEKQRRCVAHLLYSPALQRGEVMVIEDFPPVPHARIAVSVPAKVKRAYVIPGRTPVDFERLGEAVSIDVPEFTMHTGVVLEY